MMAEELRAAVGCGAAVRDLAGKKLGRQ
jgi:hypothetical protein